MSTAVQDNGKKSVAFKDMTPEQKAEYYAKLKAKREARKENKFVAPKGADYVDSAGKYTFTINPQGYDPKLHADFSEEDFAREESGVTSAKSSAGLLPFPPASVLSYSRR